VIRGPENKKAPPNESAGLEKRLKSTKCSVAHVDRPAEAGMMVPVMVRETEHLLQA
jgi:hypothetical protein